MSSDEDFPEWFRRRRYPFFRGWVFEDIDKMFRDMEKMMEEEFKTFTSRIPKDYVKEHGTEDALTISVDTPQRKYYKEITLPAKVNAKEAKTEYKNGVLEVKLPKIKEEKKPKGEPISID